MADPVTDNYSLVEPTVGGDLNLWGGVLNGGVIAPLDSILGGVLAVTITTADVSLTATQFQNATFALTGALTGNRNLVVPLSPNSATVACKGKFIVANNTTGAYTITVKTAAAGSTGVVIPQGFACAVYSDGTNVYYDNSGLPAAFLSYNGNPNGFVAGTAGSSNTPASVCWDFANAVVYVCTTTGDAAAAVWSRPNVLVSRGFDTAINLQLNVSVGSNILTVAVKSATSGGDPSAIDPVIIPFRSATLTSGARVDRSVTAALSISTVVGASQGAVNNVPFRLWIVCFDNSGTPVLGLVNCSTADRIFPLNEAALASSTQMSAAATSAGVIYTPNGTAVASKPFRILGYVDYNSGLVTAGTYNNPPTLVQLFGPGIKKPGEVVQEIYQQNGVATSGSGSYSLSATLPTPAGGILAVAAPAITAASPVNRVRVQGQAMISGDGNLNATTFIYDGTVAIAVSQGWIQGSVPVPPLPVRYEGKIPAGPTTYSIYATTNAPTIYLNQIGTGQLYGSVANTWISVEELMG